MQRFFATISPAFLRKLDQQLLINRPFLWATRIHHVLYWALLGNVFAACYAYLLPISGENIPSPWSGTIVLSLPVLSGLVFWAKSLQERGYWLHQKVIPQKSLLRNQALFGLGSLLISAIPVVFFSIVSMRLNSLMTYGDYEAIAFRQQWGILIFPFVWMMVEVFAYLRWHEILWAFVAGICLITLEIMVLGLMTFGASGAVGPILLLVLFLVQLFAFTVNAYNLEVKSSAGRTWQAICLLFASLILLYLPIAIWMLISMPSKSFATDEMLMAWLLGLLLAGTIWHLGFRKRIMQIQAQPNS
ncbi:MAG: hypothetical protein AAFN10_03570 [Bacteroidota bacterium]